MKQRPLRSVGVFFTSLALFLFLFIGISRGQSNTTKIKDASIAGTPVTPASGAVLELESNSKGFLAPRMTTAQRDAIPLAKRSDGLLIYNLTTHCFNHWSAKQVVWLSVCGTDAPAQLSIVNCNYITVYGTYTQGEALTAAEYMAMKVLVNQPGKYVVSAKTDNGYYFEKSGSFPAAGSYTIMLPGEGTPQQATPTPGDPVNIFFNGVSEPSCKPDIPVVAAPVGFAMDCDSIKVLGNYKIGVPLSANEKITVLVNVTSPGFWNVNTGTEINGIKFNGSGTFASTGLQTIAIQGTGTPTASGSNPYVLNTNSTTLGSCTANVAVAPVEYTLNCASINFQGSYLQGQALNSSNTASIEINVINPGSATISTDTVNGMTFSSGNILLNTTGVQSVTLTGSGSPIQAGPNTFSFSGTPGTTASCSGSLTVMAQAVNYSLKCGNITLLGDYAPEMLMTPSNKMKISVEVLIPGAYTIKSDTLNGISFFASGTFSAIGTQDVELQASGTSVDKGDFVYNLNTNSAAGVKTCTQNINFVYRSINILGLGEGVYQPASTTTSYASRAILAAAANFSASGAVPVKSLNIVNGGYNYDAALKNLINTNKIDIIIIGYAYKPTANTVAILTDFIQNKKGVLLHSEQGAPAQIQNLINNISGGNVTVAGTGTTLINPTVASNDPVLVGPFGDASSQYFGNDVNDANYVSNYPATMTVLAYQNGSTTRAAILKHNTLGYVFYGDSGWLAGDRTNTSTSTWPNKVDAADFPVPKPYSSNATNVYNSIIYGNSMAWAIKYVQNNTNASYLIP